MPVVVRGWFTSPKPHLSFWSLAQIESSGTTEFFFAVSLVKVPLNQGAVTVSKPKLLGQAVQLLGSAERCFRDETQILGRQKMPSQHVEAWSLPLFSPLEAQHGNSMGGSRRSPAVGKGRMTRNGTGGMKSSLRSFQQLSNSL